MNFKLALHIIPYVRMTQRGKFVDARAQRYLARKDQIAYKLKEQMAVRGWDMLPDKTPLTVRLLFVVPERLHCSDLDNLVKATIDSAQGVCFKNDLWIDEIHAIRRAGHRYMCEFAIGVIARQGEGASVGGKDEMQC